MIGGPIGKAIGEAFPGNITFAQSVTANVTADTAFGNFPISKIVTSGIDVSVTAIKAITYTVDAAIADVSAGITKAVSKIVTATAITVAADITKAAIKIVTAPVDLSVAVSRAISKTVTAVLVSLFATVLTRRRHTNNPLFFRAASGKRGFWRGSRR